MKFDLYEKVVGALKGLKETPEYGALAQNYKATLTTNDEIYIFRSVPENRILEITDEHTVINYIKPSGHAHIWKTLVNIFAKNLGKKLGHNVDVWDKQKLSLFEKIREATEDLKKGPDHEKIVKDYHTRIGYEGQIYVYDSGTILFEIKDEKKVINKFEFRGLDPVWDQLVDIFVHSLEEKLGYKVKLKNKLF